MYYNYNYYYSDSQYKSIFTLILFVLLFLLIIESPLHSCSQCCDDEFDGDEDDCDK